MAQLIKNTEVQLFKNLKPGGIWHISYSFNTCDEDFVQTIIDWLTENCVENFIVLRTVKDIVAGGFGDNLDAHRKKMFDLKKMRLGKRKIDRRIGPQWDIHLTKTDSFAFYLRWVEEQA